MQQGERFTMLDPPSLPTRAGFSESSEILRDGDCVWLALGFVVVFLFEFFDDRMHGEKEIKALLSMQVMAEIPESA